MTKTVKIILFTLFSIMCIGVAYYAFGYLQQAFDPNNPFHIKFAQSGWVVPTHFIAGAVALAISPLQLSLQLRLRWKSVHRTIGLLYVFCVLGGGISGLLMGISATGGFIAKSGFSTLAILWLFTTFQAFKFAVRGNITQHQRWIYRSIALTAAGITLRLYLGLGLGLLQLPFLTVYIPSAWLCWTLNLLACEIILYRQFKPMKSAVVAT